MKSRLIISIVCLLIVFVSNQIVERFTNIQIPFLYSYLDDVLVVPISLCIYRLIKTYKKNQLGLPFSIVFVCVIGFAFHFEGLMPMVASKYTRDGWDVMMYVIGGGWYLLFMNGVDWRYIWGATGSRPSLRGVG